MGNKEIILGLVAFSVVFLTATLMVMIAIMRAKKGSNRRGIPALERMKYAVGRLVEDGTRLHVSLGRGNLVTPQSASSLAGLALLQRLAKITSTSDKPPIATSGEALMSILSLDTLRNAAENFTQTTNEPSAGRLTGLTPFSYAAGVMSTIREENVSTTILMGNFGMEAALITEAAERAGNFTLAGSDNLTAQAVLYATARETLIGEELFAASAYTDPKPVQTASLIVQDILRWATILVLLGWGLLKAAGIL